MVKYICKKCGKKFSQKCHYVNHTEKRKYPCDDNYDINAKNPQKLEEIIVNHTENTQNDIPDNIINNINQIFENVIKNDSENNNLVNNNLVNNNFGNDDLLKNKKNIHDKLTCKYCLRNFSRPDVLKRHIIDYCKIKKQQDEEKENIFKKLLEQENTIKDKDEQIKTLIGKINILEEKVEQISKITKKNSKTAKSNNANPGKKVITNNITNNTSNSNTNTSNTTNNNNGIIFNLVNYGKEDLDKIDIKHFINNIVKNNKVCGVKIPEEILKIIHFNPAYPELNNIYISDINREKCMIYDDGMWKLSPDDKIPEVIDKVVKFSYDKDNQIRTAYPNNKPLIDRLNTINKYTKFNDGEYLEGLKEEQEEYSNHNDINEDNYIIDNKREIKRCEDFQKKTYNVFKTTLYNEGLKIKKKKN
jgi:hypothetical protein